MKIYNYFTLYKFEHCQYIVCYSNFINITATYIVYKIILNKVKVDYLNFYFIGRQYHYIVYVYIT